MSNRHSKGLELTSGFTVRKRGAKIRIPGSTSQRNSAQPRRSLNLCGELARNRILAGITSHRLRFVICAFVFTTLTLPLACRHRGDPGPGGAAPQRIVSLSPGITEILYAIGAFSSLVADTDFCDYPEEAKRLPHVGGFFTINLEAIAALHPSLVILTRDQISLFKDKLDQMAIPTLAVDNGRVKDVVVSIRALGNATGHQREAEKLADSITARVEERAKQTSSLPHPKVVCVIDHLPGTLKDIYVASSDSFIGDLVTASGAECMNFPTQNGYGKIQEEAIVDYNPEILIDVIHKTGPETAPANTAIWRQLPQITAVKDGRVVSIYQPYMVHPSQLLLESLDTLSKIIHPEVFGPYDQQ